MDICTERVGLLHRVFDTNHVATEMEQRARITMDKISGVLRMYFSKAPIPNGALTNMHAGIHGGQNILAFDLNLTNRSWLKHRYERNQATNAMR